jgi:hypothetical protein
MVLPPETAAATMEMRAGAAPSFTGDGSLGKDPPNGKLRAAIGL